MNTTQDIIGILEKIDFKVSTDTRLDLSGTLYFALKGENMDGNDFVHEALKKGAVGAVTDNPKNIGDNIFIVADALKTLQESAKFYRKLFNIPILCIGGSNGKTTSKELINQVLETKYITHTTKGNFNNHIGLPLSILSMKKESQVGVFEIGANHPNEHNLLLSILEPTHTVVTNNGMDHLLGFGSPEGVRSANKEIYDWSLEHKAKVFVNKNHTDLMTDSSQNDRVIYPNQNLELSNSNPVSIIFNDKEFITNIFGKYNIENIDLAIAAASEFGIDTEEALSAICKYEPKLNRSQLVEKNGNKYIVDCYNANPSSMMLAIESFIESIQGPRGLILGDMLELGEYSDPEHKKISDYVKTLSIDIVIFIGENFQKNITENNKSIWFQNSEGARKWMIEQNYSGYTFLLKGSRGIKVEKVLE